MTAHCRNTLHSSCVLKVNLISAFEEMSRWEMGQKYPIPASCLFALLHWWKMNRTACQAQVNACSTLYTCTPPVTWKCYERGALCTMFLWEVWCYFLLKPFTGNHTITVVKGKVDHDTLRESLANVIQDVSKLVKDGEINVDGQIVQLEFF